MQRMHGLDELEAQGRMIWIEAEHALVATPDDVVEPLSKGGFDERKCEAVAGASSDVLERDPYTDDGGES